MRDDKEGGFWGKKRLRFQSLPSRLLAGGPRASGATFLRHHILICGMGTAEGSNCSPCNAPP